MIGDYYNPFKEHVGSFIPNALMEYKGIPASAKLLWARLAQFAGRNGYCYPSQKLLSNSIGVDERQIRNLLKILEEDGFIEKKIPTGKDKLFHKNNKYLFKRHMIFSAEINFRSEEEVDCRSEEETNCRPNIRESYIRESSLNSLYEKENNNTNQRFAENDDNNQPLSKDDSSSEKQKDSIPSDIKRIIDFWNNLGLRQHKTPTSKIYRQIVMELRRLKKGVYFNKVSGFQKYKNRKFTEKEIFSVMQNFSLAALSPDYKPDSPEYKEYLRKLSIRDFLYNPRAEKVKSQFTFFFENKPEISSSGHRIPADEYPKLTKSIEALYDERVLGGIKPQENQKRKRDFRLASKNLYNFFKNNKRKINTAVVFSQGSKEFSMASVLIDAVVDNVGEENISVISTGYLCSNMTFSQRLPAYMSKQGCFLK